MPLSLTQSREHRGVIAPPAGQTPRGGTLRRLESLRWRLPIFFGVVIVAMLGTFIYAMSRTIEASLVRAGTYRARASGQQIISMMEGPLKQRRDASARLATDSTLRAALVHPDAETLARARRTLLPAAPTRSARRTELWDNHGSLVLAVATPASPTATGIHAYPPGAPPTGPEAGEMQAAGNSNFHSYAVEIRDSAGGGNLLGYVRVFGQVNSDPKGAIKRLIGDSATIKMGSAHSRVWTDFDAIVDHPPAVTGSPDAGTYRDTEGREWVGASVAIPDTEWRTWIGFPRSMIVAPAKQFMQKMLVLALVFVIVTEVLVVLLSIRLTQPLHVLADAAEQIAAGNYSLRLETRGRDEIGRLGSAFNTMTNRIEDAYVALEKSHEQTHFALAAARIGVWEMDFSTGRMVCSPSMHLLHGLPEGVLPESRDDFLELLHEEDRDAVRAVLEGRATGEDEFDLRYRTKSPGGSTHWIEGKGRIIRDDDGRMRSILGVSVDVTERMRLEAQFRQAQKMEAIGQLAGGIAHDFNNLLTVIIGHADLLLGELGEKAELRSDVDQILKASDTAAKMTHQLLAFSRSQVLRPDVIDINSVMGDTEKLLARLIGEHIHLVVDPGARLDPVRVDTAQFQQVLVNLAVNARDAMPDGGTLRIASSNKYLDRSFASEHEGVAEGAYVMLTVSDTGVGMDAETQARLFEPFFTTKAAGKGTGLGLATVYGIVRQSGGHIFVESEAGRGTTFTIYLPVATEDVAARRAEAAVSSGSGTQSNGILVVDDNDSVLIVAKTILERLGYVVTTATSGQQALEILQHARVRPRLLLSDVVMPGMSGPELYEKAAKLFPGMRVLFTSGYSPDGIPLHASLEPDFMFVEKPFSSAVLAAKVSQALA